MPPPRLLLLPLLSSLLLLGGCLWPVREHTDRMVNELASHPFDLAPPASAADRPKTDEATPAKAPGTETTAESSEPAPDVQTVALLQADRGAEKGLAEQPKNDQKGVPPPKIPSIVPGSETPPVPAFPKMTPVEKERAIREFYAKLPALPDMPAALPGPNGRPYTLADLQKLAVEYSPTLRQAAQNVVSAEGALKQARTYQNPTIAYQAQPTNNNSNAGAQGGYIDQPIRTFGKMKMSVAAAQKDLDNAQLALRRARYDLSTNVRNAYFALIVARETMRVTRALAGFTDDVYRWNINYLEATVAASYEPAGLRSQVYSIRLAYQQAITAYMYAWKQLVTTLGLTQLPLTEVAGRVDRLIPYYDYDKVLGHVLSHHTDVLTARNSVEKARYNLKLAQITPYPDVDMQAAVWKESTIAPYTMFYAVQTVMPIPVWDQNRGNIMSAQAQLGYAIEDVRRTEVALTNTLAANYTNYQNNLNALEYYRRWILPDQVRYYRGILARRQADPNASPADLMTAQQALVANVQNYLGILGTLWLSVVSVADLLQTDDLFQLAQPRELPELPDLDNLPGRLCPHPGQAAPPALPARPAAPPPVAPAADADLPVPRQTGAPESAGRPSGKGVLP